MGISKIHPIRNSVGDSISYIISPEKSIDGILISSFACDPITAEIEFMSPITNKKTTGKVVAQHMIQSFAPGEIDAATAHEIGRKLALEYTNGQHMFVISTHVDRDHIHNHIIFSAINFVTQKKFRQNIKAFHTMQNINDRLCSEYGLSVITQKTSSGKTYHEWNQTRLGRSYKDRLRINIDSLIPLVSSFDELLTMLLKMGYECKNTGAYYSFRHDGQERFTRLKTLGNNYSEEAIKLRISKNHTGASPYFTPPKKDLGLLSDISKQMDKMRNPAYANAVAISDLKRLAATYSLLNELGINSLSELEAYKQSMISKSKSIHSQIKTLETEIDNQTQAVEFLSRRDKHLPTYVAYKKSTSPKKFKSSHNTELMLYESACRGLSSLGVDPKTTTQHAKGQLSELTTKRKELLSSYQNITGQLQQLNIASKNIEKIMQDNSHKKDSKSKIKDQFL